MILLRVPRDLRWVVSGDYFISAGGYRFVGFIEGDSVHSREEISAKNQIIFLSLALWNCYLGDRPE